MFKTINDLPDGSIRKFNDADFDTRLQGHYYSLDLALFDWHNADEIDSKATAAAARIMTAVGIFMNKGKPNSSGFRSACNSKLRFLQIEGMDGVEPQLAARSMLDLDQATIDGVTSGDQLKRLIQSSGSESLEALENVTFSALVHFSLLTSYVRMIAATNDRSLGGFNRLEIEISREQMLTEGRPIIAHNLAQIDRTTEGVGLDLVRLTVATFDLLSDVIFRPESNGAVLLDPKQAGSTTLTPDVERIQAMLPAGHV